MCIKKKDKIKYIKYMQTSHDINKYYFDQRKLYMSEDQLIYEYALLFLEDRVILGLEEDIEEGIEEESDMIDYVSMFYKEDTNLYSNDNTGNKDIYLYPYNNYTLNSKYTLNTSNNDCISPYNPNNNYTLNTSNGDSSTPLHPYNNYTSNSDSISPYNPYNNFTFNNSKIKYSPFYQFNSTPKSKICIKKEKGLKREKSLERDMSKWRKGSINKEKSIGRYKSINNEKSLERDISIRRSIGRYKSINNEKSLERDISIRRSIGRYKSINNEKSLERKNIKFYYCSVPFCTKIYTSSNGLGYHKKHGHKKVEFKKKKNVSSEISNNTKIKAANDADEVKKSDSEIQKCKLHPPAIPLPSSSYTTITPPPPSQTCSKMQNSGLDTLPSPNAPVPSSVEVSACEPSYDMTSPCTLA
ncbi:hypothetical protein CWI37_0187p0030, partial [Hamiltosporidium tvaerminnensis]